MAILLTGAGGLFTRLGRLGKIGVLANTHQAALPAALDAVFDQFTSQPDRFWTADLLDRYNDFVANPAAGLPFIQETAARILLEMVQTDNRAAAESLTSAIDELRKQMVNSTDYVDECVTSVAASSIVASTADGFIHTTVKRGDGLVRQNVIAEAAFVKCEGDSFANGFTAGQEPFRYVGGAMVADRLSYDWPSGSGTSYQFNAVDAAADPSSVGQLLVNGDFEDATVANTPDDWTIEVGAAGTEVLVTTSAVYSGSKCLQIAGAATKTAISQVFGVDAAGVGTELIPESIRNYAFAFKIKVTGAPAAGSLIVELVNSAGTVIADTAGTNNTATIDLTAASSSWANPTVASGSLVWRLPRVVPTLCKVRFRLATALSVASNLFIDHVAFTPMVDPYPGGPSIAIFGGAIPFAFGDGWIVTGANNRASATYLATWQALFDRWFGMREMGLQLPYNATETILDSLITS